MPGILFYVLAGAPKYYLDMLDQLQKRICRTVVPSLAASLEPLGQRQNVTRLSLFYRYYFVECSSELVPLPQSRCRFTHYSDRLHDFSVTIPKCYRDVCVKIFFPRTVRLWSSLPAKCFPLTCDLNGIKSRVKRHFFLRALFNQFSYIMFILFFLLFLVTPCLVVERNPIKKRFYPCLSLKVTFSMIFLFCILV